MNPNRTRAHNNSRSLWSHIPHNQRAQNHAYQIDATRLKRDLPEYLAFLRTPPMDMSDIVYKRLSNGRLVVEEREEMDSEVTPTEIATEIATEMDSNGEPVLRYFDTEVEFGEEDMEIDEDWAIECAILSNEEPTRNMNPHIRREDDNWTVYLSNENMEISQGDDPEEVKEQIDETKEDVEWPI